MRDNATVYLSEDQIETILNHLGREDKPEDLDDNEVGELLDRLISLLTKCRGESMSVNQLASPQYMDFSIAVSGSKSLAVSLEDLFYWYQNKFYDSGVDIPQAVFRSIDEANIKLSEAVEILYTLKHLFET